MINELQTRLYTALRKAAYLTQAELGAAAGLSRRIIQAIENGTKLPTEEEEAAIWAATHATQLLVGEILCELMSELIGRRVSIHSDQQKFCPARLPL